MYCSDTDKHEAIRLPHLRTAGAGKIDEAIGQAERVLRSTSLWILVKVSGGNIDTATPLLPIKSE